MTNLLEETKEAIAESGHRPEDIVFIGSENSGYQCTWDEFQVLADQEYNSGFGSAAVAIDLVVVFDDGQKMWRGEYDGSEWWEHSVPHSPPKERKKIKRLIGGIWSTVEEINDEDDRD